MLEKKQLNYEELDQVSGGKSYTSEGRVFFYYEVGESCTMFQSNKKALIGVIADRGIYKTGERCYYACYNVNFPGYDCGGWFYYDDGMNFSHRISEVPYKTGL